LNWYKLSIAIAGRKSDASNPEASPKGWPKVDYCKNLPYARQLQPMRICPLAMAYVHWTPRLPYVRSE